MKGGSTSPELEKSLELIHRAATPHGFVASITNVNNYRRIWGRDGVIVSLAALQTSDSKLHDAAHQTLLTLQQHQGPHGEIPSNVSPEEQKVSYGGTAGRVDASLWFVIGCHAYWRKTNDSRFLTQIMPSIEKLEFLFGAWEFNTKGLLYIPETGDWADEYIQHGYVLYDQVLYYRALLSIGDIYNSQDDSRGKAIHAKAANLRNLIHANYWFDDCNPKKEHVYHPAMFERWCNISPNNGAYWMPYFSPTGYGLRFDAMANVLMSLFEIATPEQQETVDSTIEQKVLQPDLKILPAFSPTIYPKDQDWEKLHSAFSFEFKNKPNQFHNGGRWPLLSGFYVADLASRGKQNIAQEYLRAIHTANKLGLTPADQWGFYEYIDGKSLQPGGTRLQAWSASAAIMGHYALEGMPPLPTITNNY